MRKQRQHQKFQKKPAWLRPINRSSKILIVALVIMVALAGYYIWTHHQSTSSGNLASPASGASPNPAHSSSGNSGTGSLNLTDRTWICDSQVNLASVTVTIKNAKADAIHLSKGCSGYIGSINVVQYKEDGVKVGGASNLVVGSGSILCYDRLPLAHQDGIQAMSGNNVIFKNLYIGCYTSNNAQFFVNKGTAATSTPEKIVCDDCTIRPRNPANPSQWGNKAAQIGHSSDSGIENSIVYPGKHFTMEVSKDSTVAVNPINSHNSFPSY